MVPGHPTYMANSRTRAYFACSGSLLMLHVVNQFIFVAANFCVSTVGNPMSL